MSPVTTAAPNAYPCLREDLIIRQVDDDFVIYDPLRDRTLLLNLTAAAVLDHCDGDHTVEEMASEIARIFAVEALDIRADVESIVAYLVTHGLLSSGGSGSLDGRQEETAATPTKTDAPPKDAGGRER